MAQETLKKEIVDYFFKNSILLNLDFITSLLEDKILLSKYQKLIETLKEKELVSLNTDSAKLLGSSAVVNINWFELEKLRVDSEKGRNIEKYNHFLKLLFETKEDSKQQAKPSNSVNPITIIYSYKEDSKKRDTQDFVAYFNQRYKAIEKILAARQELKNLTSISRIQAKKEKESISFIGIVTNKQHTKNNNLTLTLEDPTGQIVVLVNKNKPDLFKEAQDIVMDEVIGIVGVNSERIVFANNILWPDTPTNKELKKSTEEGYALFLSDIHVGSNNFLEEDFNKFLSWLNHEAGNEKQKEIASKVKYLFIVGDLVDGCGIYPGQEDELTIKDIYMQYEKCAELLKKIPSNIQVIVCGGNHDAIRMSEPQPPLYKDFAESLYKLPNITLVSNPSYVNIAAKEGFSGFDVLLYHGYSFDYYVANVDNIRNKGGYDRADLIMKFLLKRRHLAPTHESTLHIPSAEKDLLVIEKVPDFFITGHIHKAISANYRNITMICGSCWQSKTAFQEKVGHHPEPSRVPIVNLQTREVKMLKFGD